MFRSLFRVALMASATAASCLACSSTSSTPSSTSSGVFSASAQNALPLADGTKVAVAWIVSSGSPDYAYVFGSGVVQSGRVAISFPSNPPAPALNAVTLGVGILVVYDGEIPEGRWENKDVDGDKLLARSARHAVIYRAGAQKVRGWDETFPVGFACGKCVPKPAGAQTPFDSYAVEDCNSLVLEGPEVEGCNWT